MSLDIQYTSRFKKDYKNIIKRKCDVKALEKAIQTLAEGKLLPKKFHDHSLSGEYQDCRECHIQPDWLLIYQINNDALTLILIRTGSHSDLFQ